MNVRSVSVVAVAALLLLASCGDDSLGTVGLYDRAPVPFVPDRTAALPAGEQSLVDGFYWAELVGPAAPDSLSFELTQAFFASSCEQEFGVDACSQGFAIVAENARTVEAAVVDLAIVTVVAESRQNFAVTGDELRQLVSGAAPSNEAPDTYSYQPYPFLLTVSAGRITEAHQIWFA